MEAVIDAIIEMVDAGEIEAFRSMCEEKQYFMIVNTELTKNAKLHLDRGRSKSGKISLSSNKGSGDQECDDCVFKD